ncbi:MAG: uracil phosphoribosyltransferase [Micavibrio aeruginosavorus]|uniref:Uracil phosphoribosyltransferase n=1 Tax=Micavibrio aeruginosavorus TaxID=349221 RepID=A0A7T5UI91_9BACT|nr:MAG: uracil phosphoribosyltransferase [Micavibrio aeruginosavorus]
MKNVHILDHPLIRHKLTFLRDKRTSTKEFRDIMREMSMLMGYEVMRNLPTEQVEIETPMEIMRSDVLAGQGLCIVSILRAGNGLLDGLLQLVPTASVGHIGLYRDPDTLIPVEYYLKFPEDVASRSVIVVDPMLATGHSAVAAIDRVRDMDVTDVKFLCIVASPEGLRVFQDAHPDVPVYTASIDRQLDDHGYILPGIGDAGDRIYGTK